MRRPHRTRRLLTALIVLLVSVASLGACSAFGDKFVERSGRSFQLDGKDWRFVGFNLYDAAASDLYSCSPDTRLSDQKLRQVLEHLHDDAGATVVRFWAYQTYTAGGKDFSGTDRVIAAAKDAGLKVIPVLEDGPGNCSTGENNVALAQVEGDTWYTQGYKKPYGSAALSFRDYAGVIARHYRDDPTIMAWMMVNEAETSTRNSGDVTPLADFALDIGTVLREADPNHLITLGTQGNGAPGTSGPDFRAIYGQPVLDFAEVHDWARYGSDTDALPGSVDGGKLPAAGEGECSSRTARIACSFAISAELGKPLLVGEAGIEAADAAGRTRRAGLLKAKITAAFANGAAGYLVWQLNTRNTDGYAVVPAEKDPLIPVLKAQAEALS